jgi:translation initiation factor RLI1
MHFIYISLFYNPITNKCLPCQYYYPLDLIAVRHRNVDELSGGELQRFACAVVCIQAADV